MLRLKLKVRYLRIPVRECVKLMFGHGLMEDAAGNHACMFFFSMHQGDFE